MSLLGLGLGLGPACAPPVAATPYPGGVAAVGARAADAPAPEPGVLRFAGQSVDLRPFLAGFPYSHFELEGEQLFYLHEEERYTLRALALAGEDPAALAAGVPVFDIDWSKRGLRSLHWAPERGELWVFADANNAERTNLYRARLPTGSTGALPRAPIPESELERFSDADYVYSYGFSADDAQVAWLARSGTRAPYRTCLRVADLDAAEGGEPGQASDAAEAAKGTGARAATKSTPRSGTEAASAEAEAGEELLCDSPELRFTWGRMLFSPDGKELYFNAQRRGDRRRVQLVRVRLDAARPRVEVLTPGGVARTGASLLEGWLDDRYAFFIADDDGFDNLHRFDRKRGRIEAVTRFREPVLAAELGAAGLFVAHGTPAGSTVEWLDPRAKASAPALARATLPGAVGTLGHVDAADGSTRVFWTQRSPELVFELNHSELRPAGGSAGGSKKSAGESGGTGAETAPTMRNLRRVEAPAEVHARMLGCRVEAVKVPTFDVDPHTGETRELHAFLMRPREGARALPLAMVRSFYGGANRYVRFDHIMCAAGVTILSPAVRGSAGFGREFAALNDRDLGGAEIVDLFYAGRYLAQRERLPAARIGVYGRSHGGYATMRALTFPRGEEPRGRGSERWPAEAFFPFGFGLADAGFSDIEAFHAATNIPDWVLLEAGDPADPEDLARIRERSPIHHAARLEAPLFVLHGGADWRVPVEGSRAFVAAADAAGKEVHYLEVEGQGHRIEGVERISASFAARFAFLEQVLANSPARAIPSTGPGPAAPAPAAANAAVGAGEGASSPTPKPAK